MPDRLSLATVAACAVLAGAVFGGAYALAHDGPSRPSPAPSSPTAIRLKDDPIGELHDVRPLPPLSVPRRRPAPAQTQTQPQPQPVVPVSAPVVAVPAPAPRPAPAPAPQPAPKAKPKPKPPVTFDDSG